MIKFRNEIRNKLPKVEIYFKEKGGRQLEKEKVKQLLTKEISEEQVKQDEPMKKHSSFKVGGNVDFYVIGKTLEEIKWTLKMAKQEQIPLTILGNGTNILVSDKGIDGIVLKIGIEDFKIEKEEEYAIITVGAGMPLAKLAQFLLKENIAGFEFAAGIPGTIGGAVRMNAGAYGGELKDCIQKVSFLTQEGEVKTISNQECDFSYRHSIFSDKNELIIIQAVLKLPYGNIEEIRKKMEEYAQSRKEKQPLEFPSAGSTFKRGVDFITAKLIDESGLKGYKVGGAQVSDKHAGFVVNTGSATATDIMELIRYVKKVVLEKTGKQIELEIELLGEF